MSDPVPVSARSKSFSAAESVSLKQMWREKSESMSTKYSQSSSSISPVSSISRERPPIKVEQTKASLGEASLTFPQKIADVPSQDPQYLVWKESMHNTGKILEEQNVDFEEVSIGFANQNDQQQLAVLLIRVSESSGQVSWHPILETIWHMLYATNSLDLHVDILTPEAEKEMAAYNIPRDHPYVCIWQNKIKTAVVELLEDVDFHEISICLWGATEAQAAATILIVVEDKTQDPWERLIEDIRGICRCAGAHDLKIVVEEGKISPSF